MRFTVLPLRDDDDWIGDVMSAVTRMVVKPPETPNDAGGPAGCASSLWTLMPCAVVFEMGATLAKGRQRQRRHVRARCAQALPSAPLQVRWAGSCSVR